jgi:hypothetical protein
MLHRSPGTNSNHSSTEVTEATIDETRSIYSSSNVSDIEETEEDKGGLEEKKIDKEENKDKDEDRSFLNLDKPLQGSEELDSGSNPGWGEATPRHPFLGQFPALLVATKE